MLPRKLCSLHVALSAGFSMMLLNLLSEVRQTGCAGIRSSIATCLNVGDMLLKARLRQLHVQSGVSESSS